MTTAKEWYDDQSAVPLNSRGNTMTRAWGFLRGKVDRVRNNSGIKSRIRALQREWLGTLTGKRVLDLGCGGGNAISLHMAEHAAEYVAFDLSDPALQKLRAKLDERGFHAAKTIVGDFLADHASLGMFDVVYANSIVHHFQPLERILKPLHERTTPGASVIVMDPLQTSPITRGVRRCFHPFRTDSEWNWPFDESSIAEIQQYFNIERVRGFFGTSKWAVPIAFVPLCHGVAEAAARRLDHWDEKKASQLGRAFWGCNSATMLWRRC